MKQGMFISFEGIDGAGKSSHIGALADEFKSLGRQVTVTREPGGTPLAEKIRAMVLNNAMDPMTEALLVFAARRDHIQNVVRPALERGDIVLCDRFTDSTFAYQGAGRGFSTHVLSTLEEWVQRDNLNVAFAAEVLQPDLTVLYDLDPAIAAARLAGARAPDKFESEQISFFAKVRSGYLTRMVNDPGRFIRLNAAQGKNEVWRDLVGPVLNALATHDKLAEISGRQRQISA